MSSHLTVTLAQTLGFQSKKALVTFLDLYDDEVQPEFDDLVSRLNRKYYQDWKKAFKGLIALKEIDMAEAKIKIEERISLDNSVKRMISKESSVAASSIVNGSSTNSVNEWFARKRRATEDSENPILTQIPEPSISPSQSQSPVYEILEQSQDSFVDSPEQHATPMTSPARNVYMGSVKTISNLREELEKTKRENKALMKKNSELEEENATLKEKVKDLDQTNTSADHLNENLKDKIERVKELEILYKAATDLLYIKTSTINNLKHLFDDAAKIKDRYTKEVEDLKEKLEGEGNDFSYNVHFLI